MKLFICHTPYHVLLSGMLADNEEAAVLVAVEDSYGTSALARELLSEEVFGACEIIPGSSTETRIGSHLIAAENIRRIDRIIARYRVNSVMIFNYSRPEGQYAANEIQTDPVLVEDGLGAYFRSSERDGLLTNVCQKLLYWSGYRPTHGLMPVSGYWKLASFFPTHVVDRRRFWPIKLSQSKFRQLCSGKVGESLLQAVTGADVFRGLMKSNEPVTVAALPLWVKDISTVRKVLSICRENNVGGDCCRERQTLVKAHPRASMIIRSRSGISTVPSSVPLELLLGQLKGRVRSVVAGLSTVLYTARILLQDTTPVRCLLRRDIDFGERESKFMRLLGIKCVRRWL